MKNTDIYSLAEKYQLIVENKAGNIIFITTRYSVWYCKCCDNSYTLFHGSTNPSGQKWDDIYHL
jgi:hypothetical protein